MFDSSLITLYNYQISNKLLIELNEFLLFTSKKKRQFRLKMGYFLFVRIMTASELNTFVRSVTVRKILAVFAHAEPVVFFFCFEFHGSVRGALVGAVAERLVFGQSTGAVVVLFSNFKLYS